MSQAVSVVDDFEKCRESLLDTYTKGVIIKDSEGNEVSAILPIEQNLIRLFCVNPEGKEFFRVIHFSQFDLTIYGTE